MTATRIRTITVTADTIRITTDFPVPAEAAVAVIPFSPILAEEVEPLGVLTPAVDGDTLVIPRFACGRDGACLSYGVQVDDELLEGVQYAEAVLKKFYQH